MSEQLGQEITCKKIQNYIFNFNDLLGQGNFSKVYKAHNEITKDVVAIKIIELNSLKSKKLEELLFSEIDILKKLNHPNVLRCHEVFTSNRNCYIITELCDEGDLESKLRTKKYLKEFEADGYIRDIFKGLMYLAENYIVHRDLKVANIFIHKGQAKIADFGFAKFTKNQFKDINIGSPIYMSPQGLINNIYGPKTDIWAFGMLIYELLHGQTPFSHCKSQHELKYNMSIPIGWSQLKADLSNQIKEVILKCLEVEETKRISASDLKKLPYFRRSQSLSPMKMASREQLSINSYDYRVNGSFNNESLGIGSINENKYNIDGVYRNNFNDGVKNRIKTENTLQPMKKTAREYSDLPIRENNNYYQSDKRTREYAQIPLQNNHHTKRLTRELSQLPTVRTVPSKQYSNAPLLKSQKSASNFLKQPLQQQKNRRLSNGKYSVSSNQLLPNYSKINNQSRQNSSNKLDPILSSYISFKQCVNILHYCRLIFKHLILMRQIQFGDENQTSIFKKWLAAILKTLIKQINQKKIRCQGENSQARQKKLQQVTSQYIKKYSKDLNLDLSKVKLQQSLIINYDKITNYFASIYQMIDQIIQKDSVNKSLLQLGHYIIMIYENTKVLKKCYEDRSYKNIQKLKDIEEFLAQDKYKLDFPSYQWFKKKYLMGGMDYN